jgi:lauroyl/myristoyl acyltransferase
MNRDSLVVAARDLIDLGVDAFAGPHTDAFVDEVSRQHPAGAIYQKATAEAIAQRDLQVASPEDVAAGVYANFIWTHFVCKVLLTASPAVAVEYVATRFDVSELQSALDAGGPAILSCFHYTGYPLMALGLAMSPMAPLISKARVDFLEKSSEEISEHVVYLSDRSAAIRLTRALKQGRSVWILLDVVLPSVRVVRTQFLGLGMDVGAGIGKIARLSERPCIPLFWELTGQRTVLHAGPAVHPTDGADEALIQDFVNTQAAFIARNPTHWLEWYSVLDEAPSVRAEVKRGNDELWSRLALALG